jgi:hypothetical protein
MMTDTPNTEELIARLEKCSPTNDLDPELSDDAISALKALSAKLARLEAERDTVRELWLEWLEGVYDGPDLLRRVRLAVHGPLAPQPPAQPAREDQRYTVVKGSQLGHGCCFDATVVDRTKPELDAGGEPIIYKGQPLFAVVCECFDEADAQTVCDSLNAAAGKEKP